MEKFIKVFSAAVLFVVILFALQVVLIKGYINTPPGNAQEKSEESANCLLFDCYRISYATEANVTEPSFEIGFGAGKEDLKFGQIPKGSKSMRYIEMKGSDDEARIKLIPYGNISPYIHFSSSDFVLGDGEEMKISVEFQAAPEMEEGRYTGSISLIKISPKYQFVDFLLGWI